MSGPVFVGGTGRSGTSIISALIGAHAHLEMVPVELRIHVQRHGLVDVVTGRSSLAEFEQRARGPWFRRARPDGRIVGLHRLIDEVGYLDALDAFADAVATDPRGAARTLIDELLRGVGRPGVDWVEHSPENVLVAATLLEWFPEARFVNCLRDGRDTACSIATRPWGPNEHLEALRWWGHRVARAHAELSGLPPNRVTTVRFEDVVADGGGVISHLLGFLGLADDPGPWRYLDERITSDQAHVGRWRRDVDPGRLEPFNRTYREILERLCAAGVPVDIPADAPDLDRAALEQGVATQLEYEAGAT